MAAQLVDEAMRQCIETCGACHASCSETAAYCLEQGGGRAEAEHIRSLLDCAEICQTSASFMLRGSPFHTRTCSLCADVCDQCAQACEQFDDVVVRRCAEQCRQCAESCRAMAVGPIEPA